MSERGAGLVRRCRLRLIQLFIQSQSLKLSVNALHRLAPGWVSLLAGRSNPGEQSVIRFTFILSTIKLQQVYSAWSRREL
jgi:hypothetical protein